MSNRQDAIDDLTQAVINRLREDYSYYTGAWPRVQGIDVSPFFAIKYVTVGNKVTNILVAVIEANGDSPRQVLVYDERKVGLWVANVTQALHHLVEFVQQQTKVEPVLDGVPKSTLLAMYRDQLAAVDNAVEIMLKYRHCSHVDGTHGNVPNEYWDRLRELNKVQSSLREIISFLLECCP
jgi:hypothetical protein